MNSAGRRPEAPEHVLRAASPLLRQPPEDLEAFARKQDFFSEWLVWMVSDGCMPPDEVHVAERDDRAVVIRLEDGLRPLAEVEPVKLSSPDEVTAYARWFIEVTLHPTHVIDSIEDIIGPVESAIASLTVEVVPPRVAQQGDGRWHVTMFVHELDWLATARLRIDDIGSVDAEIHRIAEGLSIFSAWD